MEYTLQQGMHGKRCRRDEVLSPCLSIKGRVLQAVSQSELWKGRLHIEVEEKLEWQGN